MHNFPPRLSRVATLLRNTLARCFPLGGCSESWTMQPIDDQLIQYSLKFHVLSGSVGSRPSWRERSLVTVHFPKKRIVCGELFP